MPDIEEIVVYDPKKDGMDWASLTSVPSSLEMTAEQIAKGISSRETVDERLNNRAAASIVDGDTTLLEYMTHYFKKHPTVGGVMFLDGKVFARITDPTVFDASFINKIGAAYNSVPFMYTRPI